MRLRLAFLVVIGSLNFPVAAAAEVVVLVHPPAADPFVQEIFHRLGGELRVHSFQTRQEEGPATNPTISGAAALLERTHADACVFVGWQGDTSVVHVWVAGTNTPPALFEAVALQRSNNVPTILAARAVDLLTAGLDAKKRPRAAAAPAAVAEVGPDPGARVESREPLVVRWSTALGALMLADVSKFGAAWGPQVAAERSLSRRLDLVAQVAAPLVGARHANADASAKLVQTLALGQILGVISRGPHLTFRVGGGGGAYYVRAQGTIAEGISSVVPGHDDHWAAAGVVSADGALAFSSRVSAVLSTQALFLAPRPRVAVAREKAALAEPLLGVALTIRFAF